MGGTIPLEEFYVDDTLGGTGSHYQYPESDIAEMIESGRRLLANPNALRGRAQDQSSLLKGLLQFPIEGMRVAIFGSMSPWAEALCIAAGAAAVVTVEYNQLTYDHEMITTMTPGEFFGSTEASRVDVAVSMSSFDHDGLGRYGDPINPDGDLRVMRALWCSLPAHAKLYLSVPVGPDVVVWNLHRRYGTLRLPHLLAGWNPAAAIGWDAARLSREASWRMSYEPLLILEKPQCSAASQEMLCGGNPFAPVHLTLLADVAV